ncbi:MAG: porin, partial [Planctomycetia bacterium]|nr:porin [Planctomycetia bacterium]
FGVVNYLNYQFDEKWIGNARLEFFSDPQAQRTGFDGTYTAVTAGVIYKPLPGLWVRPEVRFDHNDSRPFEGNPSVFTAAFDVVVRW